MYSRLNTDKLFNLEKYDPGTIIYNPNKTKPYGYITDIDYSTGKKWIVWLLNDPCEHCLFPYLKMYPTILKKDKRYNV